MHQKGISNQSQQINHLHHRQQQQFNKKFAIKVQFFQQFMYNLEKISTNKQNRFSKRQLFHLISNDKKNISHCSASEQVNLKGNLKGSFNKQNINFQQNTHFQRFEQDAQKQKKIKGQQKQLCSDLQTEQIFKIIQRNLISSQQREQFSKKNRNFYQNLRIKLINQVDEISRDYKKTQKEKQNFELLIEGCNNQKHKRKTVSNSKYAKRSNYLQPKKTKINQLKLNLNFDSVFINKKRNLSNISQTNQSSKSTNLFKTKQTSIQITKKRNYSYRKDFSKQENDLNSSLLQKNQRYRSKTKLPISTTKRSMSMKLYHKQSQIQQNLNQKNDFINKLQQLKTQCQYQSSKANELKKKMNLFGHYCQNLDKGFDTISTKIKNYISNL